MKRVNPSRFTYGLSIQESGELQKCKRVIRLGHAKVTQLVALANDQASLSDDYKCVKQLRYFEIAVEGRNRETIRAAVRVVAITEALLCGQALARVKEMLRIRISYAELKCWVEKEFPTILPTISEAWPWLEYFAKHHQSGELSNYNRVLGLEA